MKPITLIQLISEQAMQNLLPVSRLKPARLVHLMTPKTTKRSESIVKAARQSGVEPEIELVTLSDMPAIHETLNAVAAAIDSAHAREEVAIVNFTGGTKLMSIGGYAAALNRKAHSLYVDTQDEMFVDGRTSADGLSNLLEHDFSFTPLRTALTVDTIAVANGKERVTSGRDWKPFLPLARHFLDNPKDEEATHNYFWGQNGLLASGKEPKQPEQWLSILDRKVVLPSLVLELAFEAGVLQAVSKDEARLPDYTRADLENLAEARKQNRRLPDYDFRRIAAIKPIQDAINLLTGGWWEVLVADAASKAGIFRDIRWSVEVGEHGGASMEEDILALDGVKMVCISCKRSGDRLLPLLEEINARAQSIGGSFARKFLAIYHPPKGNLAKQLKRRAQELGILLLSPANLSRPDAFGPS